MTLSRDEVMTLLLDARKDLDTFDRATYREDRWVRWHNQMRATLRKVFGDESVELKGYQSVSSWGRPIAGIGLTEEKYDELQADRFESILGGIRGWLDALMFQIEKFGVGSEQKPGHDEAAIPEPSTATPLLPKRYRYTSPVYLAELVWSGCGWITQWVIDHKIHSIVIIGVPLVASILTILAFAGVIEA